MEGALCLKRVAVLADRDRIGKLIDRAKSRAP
jgi:hypothetical protein